MLLSLAHILLAIFGLGFLIFIHELGHFWMARRQGMKIEAFAIGFGKPLYKWERNGVKWQIGCLPFGGYVRIAGMQREGNILPADIEGGYYKKTPWQRIKVALAGPLVNLVFAFVIFSLLWTLGGREKPFALFTHRIGVVDSHSQLYEKGVRPGDEIVEYNGRPFHGFKDIQIASLRSEPDASIRGYQVDTLSGERTPFHYTLPTYHDPRYANDDIRTIGVLAPASYLIYRDATAQLAAASGLEKNDRLLWADGEFLYSLSQLSAVVSESTALLTVRRGDDVLLSKVPRVRLGDLKMSAPERGEIDDWQHEAGIKGRLSELFFIPYNLSPSTVVEGRLPFIDIEDQRRAFERCDRCATFPPLQEGDQILAVDGTRIKTPYELIERLQTRRVTLLVQRGSVAPVSWKEADAEFAAFDRSSVDAMISSIGTETPIAVVGDLHLLRPLTPHPTPKMAPPREISAIKDDKLRAIALEEWETSQRKQVLGILLSDEGVVYNPSPVQQFSEAVQDTGRTLSGLVSGSFSPKYMSGPVGIVRVMELSWQEGFEDALYWMALISLNLGLFNLLPIPVLDGGHILFSLWEMAVKKPIQPKTMERLIFPFIGLLIAFFLFVTFHDISRLFG